MSGELNSVSEFNVDETIDILSNYEGDCAISVEKNVASALRNVETFGESRSSVIEISQKDGIDDLSFEHNSDHIGSWIINSCDNVIGIVAERIPLLYLQLQLLRGLGSKRHIVSAASPYNRDESAKTMIQRLASEPIPLSPAISQSSVVRTISSKRNRPHNACFEISCYTLVL